MVSSLLPNPLLVSGTGSYYAPIFGSICRSIRAWHSVQHSTISIEVRCDGIMMEIRQCRIGVELGPNDAD